MNKADVWAPYEPSPQAPWDLRTVAHLHRRAGFGGTWAELERDLKAGPAESIERLLHPDSESQEFRRVADALLRATQARRDFSLEGDPRSARVWWLYRMVFGRDPLAEKLTLFWHNHFATVLHGIYNLQLMLDQNELFRKHARGKFGELLSAVESDTAMLIWLDGGSNQKDHPNENFARELLELFTLGSGHFSESDVRAAARGLTGWDHVRDNQLFNKTNEFRYDDELADIGAKTFLGQTGPWRHHEILRIILQQPDAARHLCRRLYRWFISESAAPSDELIEPLATQLRASNYSIEHVVGIMLRSRHFFSPASYRQRVKSPVEFCVGTIRQLEPRRTPNLLFLAALSCERQGQILFDPPSVKGWEGGKSWLDSNGTLLRLNWIAEFLSGNQAAAVPPYDPKEWIKQHAIEPATAINSFAALLLQDDVNPATLSLAKQLVSAGGESKLPSALQVLLQTPEYQLA
jgi:uncharacterized protein (DUF1800 family)